MQNDNPLQVFKIDLTLAKIIINKHFFFKDFNQESEYAKLPGHYQRAISREAAFQVKTLSQTEGLSELLTKDDMAEAQTLHDAICEYYAHKGLTEMRQNHSDYSRFFATLLEADSHAISRGAAREEDPRQDKTYRRAKHINKDIAAGKAEGKWLNPQESLQIIYANLNKRYH